MDGGSCHSSAEQRYIIKSTLPAAFHEENGYSKSPNFQMHHILEKKSEI